MIVDDNDEIRRMLREVLADLADPIYECHDGGEAGAAYGTHRPDWVLMDVSMEPVDGIAATRHIIQAFPDARVVMVTQHADASLRNAAHQAGACGYLLKDNLLEVRRFLEALSGERTRTIGVKENESRFVRREPRSGSTEE
jgi:NarL family two-component system response regulator LiaR